MVAQYEGREEDEVGLQTQFNEGELRRDDCDNEFYDSLELPKILRELDTDFIRMHLYRSYPPPRNVKSKIASRSGSSQIASQNGKSKSVSRSGNS